MNCECGDLLEHVDVHLHNLIAEALAVLTDVPWNDWNDTAGTNDSGTGCFFCEWEGGWSEWADIWSEVEEPWPNGSYEEHLELSDDCVLAVVIRNLEAAV